MKKAKVSNILIKVNDADGYIKKAFFDEVNIMMRLKSNNIIRFLDVNETKSNYYIMLEMANQGTFRDILYTKGIHSE